MSGNTSQPAIALFDPATGAPVGLLGSDGTEYLIPALNSQSGQANFEIGQTQIVVSNLAVNPTSVIVANLGNVDSSLTQIVSIIPGAGEFTVTGNAPANAIVSFNYAIFS